MSELAGARQIVLITTRYKEKDNVMAAAWHTQLSFEPDLYAISIGKTRFNCELIKKSKCFCINFMPSSLRKEIIHCGSVSGRNHDKFKETGLLKGECEKINCPRIKQAIGYVECKLVKQIETGDHVLFVGKVLKSELLDKSRKKRLFHITADKYLEA